MRAESTGHVLILMHRRKSLQLHLKPRQQRKTKTSFYLWTTQDFFRFSVGLHANLKVKKKKIPRFCRRTRKSTRREILKSNCSSRSKKSEQRKRIGIVRRVDEEGSPPSSSSFSYYSLRFLLANHQNNSIRLNGRP